MLLFFNIVYLALDALGLALYARVLLSALRRAPPRALLSAAAAALLVCALPLHLRPPVGDATPTASLVVRIAVHAFPVLFLSELNRHPVVDAVCSAVFIAILSASLARHAPALYASS